MIKQGTAGIAGDSRHVVKERALRKTAEETGFDEQTVNFVINDVEKSLRFYMDYPMYAPRALRVKNFGAFVLNKHALLKIHRLYKHPKIKAMYKNLMNRFFNDPEMKKYGQG